MGIIRRLFYLVEQTYNSFVVFIDPDMKSQAGMGKPTRYIYTLEKRTLMI